MIVELAKSFLNVPSSIDDYSAQVFIRRFDDYFIVGPERASDISYCAESARRFEGVNGMSFEFVDEIGSHRVEKFFDFRRSWVRVEIWIG